MKSSGSLNKEIVGFSLAELMLAMSLIAIIVLTVIALTVAVLRSSQEAADTTVGVSVCEAELQRVIMAAQADPDFWNLDYASTPYSTTTVVADGTEYRCEIFASTVMDGGSPLGSAGGATENRLKKVDIKVTWWDSQSEQHQGYGKLEIKQSRLVSEIN